MAKIKGSIFTPWVKTIRKDKSGAFDKYLNDEDRKLISGKILTSSWYPLETYMKVVNAVIKEFAKDDMELVWRWGRDFVDQSYRDIYKNLFSETDPKKVMKSHQLMYKTLYDFVDVEAEEVSDNEYILTYKGVDPSFKSFFYSALGTFEKSLEEAGAKGLKVEFIDKNWEGAPATRVRFSWTNWG